MVVVLWIIFCIVIGKYAQKKGRNFWTYALLSALISPIGGLIVLLISGNKKPEQDTTFQAPYSNIKASGSTVPEPTPSLSESGDSHAFCTNCGSKLEPGSKFCPSCGTKLE